jgi:hypothetical protein
MHQPAVGLTTAQEDVLPVVDRQLAPPEGKSGTAEPWPALDELHGRTGIGQAKGR